MLLLHLHTHLESRALYLGMAFRDHHFIEE